MSNGCFRSFTSSLDSVCQFVDNYFAINTLLTIHFGRVMFLDRFDLGVHVHLEEGFTIVLHLFPNRHPYYLDPWEIHGTEINTNFLEYTEY